MEQLTEAFIKNAAEARDFKLVLGYQWIVNAAETHQFDDVFYEFMKEKAKGY